MSELDDKLNSILSNPQLMQQIMTLAQSMNQQSTPNPVQTPPEAPQNQNAFPNVSTSMLSKVSDLMQRGSIDKNQQSLLKALSPYLSAQKIQKLERAMYAAKMAGIASEFVIPKNGNSFSGR